MRSRNKFLIFLISTFFLNISYLSLGNEKDYSFLIKKGMKYFKDKNYDLAEKTWKPVADSENIEAQFYMGTLYEEQNQYDLAEKYYRLAADKGYLPAQNYLGHLYYFKKKDYKSAEKYYQMSADQGSDFGYCGLGYVYNLLGKKN